MGVFLNKIFMAYPVAPSSSVFRLPDSWRVRWGGWWQYCRQFHPRWISSSLPHMWHVINVSSLHASDWRGCVLWHWTLSPCVGVMWKERAKKRNRLINFRSLSAIYCGATNNDVLAPLHPVNRWRRRRVHPSPGAELMAVVKSGD